MPGIYYVAASYWYVYSNRTGSWALMPQFPSPYNDWSWTCTAVAGLDDNFVLVAVAKNGSSPVVLLWNGNSWSVWYDSFGLTSWHAISSITVFSSDSVFLSENDWTLWEDAHVYYWNGSVMATILTVPPVVPGNTTTPIYESGGVSENDFWIALRTASVGCYRRWDGSIWTSYNIPSGLTSAREGVKASASDEVYFTAWKSGENLYQIVKWNGVSLSLWNSPIPGTASPYVLHISEAGGNVFVSGSGLNYPSRSLECVHNGVTWSVSVTSHSDIHSPDRVPRGRPFAVTANDAISIIYADRLRILSWNGLSWSIAFTAASSTPAYGVWGYLPYTPPIVDSNDIISITDSVISLIGSRPVVKPVNPHHLDVNVSVTRQIAVTVTCNSPIAGDWTAEVQINGTWETAFIYNDSPQFKTNWRGPNSAITSIAKGYQLVLDYEADFPRASIVRVRVDAQDHLGYTAVLDVS